MSSAELVDEDVHGNRTYQMLENYGRYAASKKAHTVRTDPLEEYPIEPVPRMTRISNSSKPYQDQRGLENVRFNVGNGVRENLSCTDSCPGGTIPRRLETL
jgi:hypothetical protein